MIEHVSPALRLLLVLAFIALGVLDVRTRRCPRWVWYPIALTGATATLLDVALTPAVLPTVGTSLALCGLLAALLWRTTAGNADAKALAVLAIAFPTAPTVVLTWAPPLPFALTVFLNTMVVALPVTLALAATDRLERGVPFLAFVAAGLLLAVSVGDLALLGIVALG